MAKIDDLAQKALADKRRVDNLEKEYRELKAMFDRPPHTWQLTEEQFRKNFDDIKGDTLRAYEALRVSEGRLAGEAQRLSGNDRDKGVVLGRERLAYWQKAQNERFAKSYGIEDREKEARTEPVGSLASSLEQKKTAELAKEWERAREADRVYDRERAEAIKRAKESFREQIKEPDIGGRDR